MSEAVSMPQLQTMGEYSVQDQHLLESCRYSSNGCHVKDYRRDIRKHEEVCVYSPIACPFCVGHETKPILAYGIFQHMHFHHRMYTISTDDKFVLIPINLNKDSDQFSLFIMHNEKFLARVRLDTALQTLYCIVYCNSKIVQHLSCSITIEGDSFNLQKVDFPVLPATKFSNYLTKDNCAMFSLEKLRKLFTEVTIRLNVTLNAPKGVVCDQKLLTTMRCVICRELMKPPIWLCSEGHSICSNCSFKFNRCPLCSKGLDTTYRNLSFEKFLAKQKTGFTKNPKCKSCKTHLKIPFFVSCDGFSRCGDCTGNRGRMRNHALEMLHDVLSYPCVYRSNGCLQYVAANFSNRHDLFCAFKKFSCPFHPETFCDFEGNFNDLLHHLKKFHENDLIFDDKFMRTIDDVEMVVGDIVCFVVFDHIFIMKYRNASNHHEWVIQLIAGTEQIQHFTYKIKCLWAKDQEFTLCNDTTTTGQVGFSNIFHSVNNHSQNSCLFTFAKHIPGTCRSFSFSYVIKKHIEL